VSRFRKVIKTGNSLAITIPSSAVEDMGIVEGDMVEIKIDRSQAKIDCLFKSKAKQLSLMSKK